VHNFEAARHIVPLIMQWMHPRSVLDVGCGLGTWLKVFEEHGVTEYLGLDGNHVDRQLLKIPSSRFQVQDLEANWKLERIFDLVISLEVAEHLKKASAERFVDMLIAHGDVILFSAAIPGQGGQRHINEQWLSFWVDLFGKKQFIMFDAIRPRVWNNVQVDVWYKQNMVIFCKKDHLLEERLRGLPPGYVDLVHPELFTFYHRRADRATLYENGRLGIRIALRALIRSIIAKFK
jgi:SAM-dependent methyltransferase